MKPITVEFDNQTFHVYDNSPEWISHKPDPKCPHRFGGNLSMLEHIFTDVLVEQLEKHSNWNFLDIGANFGAYTVIAAKRTSGDVYAFEPQDLNYRMLEKNILELKDDSNVYTFPIALGATESTKLLEIANQPGAHYIRNANENTLHTQPIKVFPLDSFVPDHNIYPHIIKMDVEGHGCEVLKGGIETFKQAEILLIELHDRMERGLRVTGEMNLIQEIPKLGFNLSLIHSTKVFDFHEWYRVIGFVAIKPDVDLNHIFERFGGQKI